MMLAELAPLTGVVAHVGVGGQLGDVVRVDHVGVPLAAVAGVVEDVVQRLRVHVLTDDPHLRQGEITSTFQRSELGGANYPRCSPAPNDSTPSAFWIKGRHLNQQERRQASSEQDELL